MVEIIGVATFVALSWVLAASMANESDAEKRRRARMALLARRQEEAETAFGTRDAA